MEFARPLPRYLATRYRGWKATRYAEDESWFHQLARDGQHPRAMVISCSDSRVHVTSIFEADEGEFFIHRNIASLVPPYSPETTENGTPAAVEYAVRVLHVAHLIVIGHSGCGGVHACLDMCSAKTPDPVQGSSFIAKWLEILRPGVEQIDQTAALHERLGALERQAVIVSLRNLMSYPFVRDAVESADLSLHGLWQNIGAGELEYFDAGTGGFQPL